MDRAAKEKLVATLHDVFDETGVVVVTHYAGMTVAQMTEYRSQIKEVGGSVKVAKNRLAKLALKDTQVEGISDLFKGPTCLAYSDDPVTAAKITVNFAKDNKQLVVLGGAMGTTVMDANAVKSLAALPSLDELRGKLVGLIQAPATKIVRVLNEPGTQIARVVQAKSAQDAA